MTSLTVLAATTDAVLPALPLDARWSLLVMAAGLVASWILVPPSSLSGRAAWTALLIGFLAVCFLVTFDHRADLVIGLPIAVAAAPLAIIRRHKGGSQSDVVPAAVRRLRLGAVGALLLAFGVNMAVLNPGHSWAGGVILVGTAITIGLLPFHRPGTESLRQSHVDIRSPVLVLLGPALWIGCLKWAVPLITPLSYTSSGRILLIVAVATLWIGSLLILARGDLPRLTTATMLFVAGRVGVAAAISSEGDSLALHVAASSAAPLMLITMLLARLEAMSGTRELSELGGLARRVPRFSLLLFLGVVWLAGIHLNDSGHVFWTIWLGNPNADHYWRNTLNLTPVLAPLLIALWGWVRILDALLAGLPRTPVFPEPLRDRVEAPLAERPLDDLSYRELAVIAVFIAIAFIA